jgi:hypothetical protein
MSDKLRSVGNDKLLTRPSSVILEKRWNTHNSYEDGSNGDQTPNILFCMCA